VQTRTLAIGGAAIVAIAIWGAIQLRPLEVVPLSAVAPETVVVPAEEAVPNSPDTAEVVEATPTAVEPDVPEVMADVAVEEPQSIIEAPGIEEPISEVEEPQADADPIVAVSEEAVVEPIEEPLEAAAPIAPRHTEFRFEPDGALLIMGTAAPDLPLSLRVNGEEVASVAVGSDGGFLFTQFLGYSDEPRAMLLVSDPEGQAILSERTFLLAANPAPQVAVIDVPEVVEPLEDPTEEVVAELVVDEPLEPVTEDVVAKVQEEVAESPLTPETDVATSDETAGQDETPVIAATESAPTPDEVAEVQIPAAPAIIAVDETGVQIIQPAVEANAPPEVMSNVALDTITYDPDGEVVLQGRGLGEGFVQVYVDNTPVSRLPVDDDGTWRGGLPDVDTGVYTLRIDEVSEDGTVISRIETPFLREDPEDVAEALAEDIADPEFTIATRTVQPGATLWAIAEERYGDGVLYVNVFEANKDRIRDPDLIYPGQVFLLPEGDN